jgi:Tol biopolymer transport system component
VLLLALFAMALVMAGSQQRIPPPFGPAKNGILTFSAGGDIYRLSSVDEAPGLLISGQTLDVLPSFSRDGRHLWFMRDLRTTGSGFSLMVAEADGSSIRRLIDLPDIPEWADQSPDGSELVFAGLYQGVHGIYLMRTDGSETPRRLDLGSDDVGWPMWRRPDGHQLLYLRHRGQELRLYAAAPDGSGGRSVADLGAMDDASMDQFDPVLSPDGRFMVYARLDPEGFRNHRVDIDTGRDQQLLLGPGTGHELHDVLSPDGTKLLFHFHDGEHDAIQEMLAPIDASEFAIRIGPSYPVVNGSADLNQMFSPDGSSIVINQGRDKEIRIVDAAKGGPGRVEHWHADDLPGWQRLAP